jgi:hypothetical protein
MTSIQMDAASISKGLAVLRTRICAWPWGLLARILAATVLNYGLTSLITAGLARLLPTSAVEASTTATLASFLIFAVLAMTAFAVRSVLRLWGWMIGAGAVLAGVLWWSLEVGGRV